MEQQKLDQAPEIAKIDLIRLIREFLKALRKLFFVPLVLAVVLGAFMGFRAWRGYAPQYKSEATFTIQLITPDLYNSYGSSDYYNSSTAGQLATVFPYLLESELMQTALRAELGVDWINGSIRAGTVDNTNFFSLSVTSGSPQDAYDIVCAVMTVYPDVANYVLGSIEMNVLSEPTLPTEPYNTFSAKRTIAMGALAGIALGLGLIFIYAAGQRTIRKKEDVRKSLNQTCLATLPKVNFKRRAVSSDQTVSILNPKVGNAFQESVRSLRIKLMRKLSKDGSQVVMVTSTQAGEGKSTVSVNLALSLSQSGLRVILVDLDLRKPAVKKTLGIKTATKGVPEIFKKNSETSWATLATLKGTQLRILAGDVAAPDPQRIMESRRLASLITKLREEADVVILDTPPCGLLADSAALANVVDGALYVIRSERAQVSQIMDGLQFLSSSGIPVLGCVLNDAVESNAGYGNGYGYGGKSDYGHETKRSGKYKSYQKEQTEE